MMQYITECGSATWDAHSKKDASTLERTQQQTAIDGYAGTQSSVTGMFESLGLERVDLRRKKMNMDGLRPSLIMNSYAKSERKRGRIESPPTGKTPTQSSKRFQQMEQENIVKLHISLLG
ncbi:uncharacterized protein LOC130053847 [Ostrea edulis]|uniref:uncharacterized protein LOC130053847 n=1 Tax=Ostrea edulis TaxID=37623 RepID=UPI0024AF6C47|nr:uncharacterized protein LOC130053847 [Ostrea edulis]